MEKIRNRMRTTGFKMIALLMLVCIVSLLAGGTDVQAAGKPYLKKMSKVIWDLKKGKLIHVKNTYYGAGTQRCAAKISKIATKDGKNGYSVTNITLKTNAFKPTGEQVDKMYDKIQSTGRVGNTLYWTVVDYYTGKCLEPANKWKVTVTSSSTSKVHTYQGTGDKTVSLSNWIYKIKIKYPTKYKNRVCLGVCGFTKAAASKVTDQFFAGKAYFGRTTMYSKNKRGFAHFMRIK